MVNIAKMKITPFLVRIYEQMPNPKDVIAMGSQERFSQTNSFQGHSWMIVKLGCCFLMHM